MERSNVSSSMIDTIGYEQETKELEIQFNSGNTVTYYDVPLTVYQEIMQSPSKGKFFHLFIKDQYSWD